MPTFHTVQWLAKVRPANRKTSPAAQKDALAKTMLRTAPAASSVAMVRGPGLDREPHAPLQAAERLDCRVLATQSAWSQYQVSVGTGSTPSGILAPAPVSLLCVLC